MSSVAAVPVNVGWTPAAWMGFIQNILLAALGGGGLKILANHFLSLRQIAAQRVKDVDERGDKISDRLAERVTELETALSVERRECDKQLAEMRAEIRGMQEKIDGLVRQLIAAQVAQAQHMPNVSPQMQRAIDSVKGIKDIAEGKADE